MVHNIGKVGILCGIKRAYCCNRLLHFIVPYGISNIQVVSLSCNTPSDHKTLIKEAVWFSSCMTYLIHAHMAESIKVIGRITRDAYQPYRI